MLTYYIPRDSGLHALNPITKLVLAAASLAAAFLLPWSAAPWVVFGLFLVPLSLWGKVGRAFLRTSIGLTLPFAISLFLIQGLFWPGGHALLPLGPLSVKAEGIAFAFLFTSRILVIIAAFLILLISTHPGQLLMALIERGLPSSMAYVVAASLQLLPQFQAKANAILNAQRARGLETEGRLATRLRALVPLIGPLILGSLVDVEERAIAMEARGFSIPGPKTSLIEIRDSKIQGALRRGLVGLVLLILVARLMEWLR